MKKLINVVEVEGEGLAGLLGQRVTVWCLNYIYEGDLVGVNDECIRLDNADVVYETGELQRVGRKDAQRLPGPAYVMTRCIEMFTEMR